MTLGLGAKAFPGWVSEEFCLGQAQGFIFVHDQGTQTKADGGRAILIPVGIFRGEREPLAGVLPVTGDNQGGGALVGPDEIACELGSEAQHVIDLSGKGSRRNWLGSWSPIRRDRCCNNVVHGTRGRCFKRGYW